MFINQPWLDNRVTDLLFSYVVATTLSRLFLTLLFPTRSILLCCGSANWQAAGGIVACLLLLAYQARMQL